MAEQQTEVEVREQTGDGRFEALVDGDHAGYAFYTDEPGLRHFTHTKVDDAFGGQGVGAKLVGSALDNTRANGLSVVAECSYVAKFIDRHPDYQDLLAQSSAE